MHNGGLLCCSHLERMGQQRLCLYAVSCLYLFGVEADGNLSKDVLFGDDVSAADVHHPWWLQ